MLLTCSCWVTLQQHTHPALLFCLPPCSAARAQLKAATDPATRAVLDCRQKALKVRTKGAEAGAVLAAAARCTCPAAQLLVDATMRFQLTL